MSKLYNDGFMDGLKNRAARADADDYMDGFQDGAAQRERLQRDRKAVARAQQALEQRSAQAAA